MRFSVNNTHAVKIAEESFFSRTLIIQNLDNWDVYFAPTRNALQQLDSAGNPFDGFKLNGNPLPMILPDFYGTLWAFTTNGTAARVQVIEIETSSNKLLDAVRKIGKKFGVALLLLLSLALPAKAQWGLNPPDCIVTLTAQSAQRSFTFDNRSNACTTWQLVYTNDGFSAVSVELDEAPASSGAAGAWSTWPSSNIPSGSLPLTATTSGQITAYKFFPFISILINSTTGTGTIRSVAFGYTPRGTNIDINSVGGVTPIPDACQTNTNSFGVINAVASVQIIAGVTGLKTYICGIQFQTWTTQNVTLVEGTGLVCATGTSGMAGGTTTSTGWTFQGGGSLNAGWSGISPFRTATAGDNVCLLSSSTGQISGVFRYVQQ